MDDIFDSIAWEGDEAPSLVDEVVNVYLVSGDIIPLQKWDAHELFDTLLRVGHVTARDRLGTNIHLFQHGVAAIAGFSKVQVEKAREESAKNREKFKRIFGVDDE